MGCIFCVYVAQFLLNIANLLDHAANALLLGDANETISMRTARARRAGQPWAHKMCRLLTFLLRTVTLGVARDDHCSHVLDHTKRPNSREIWDWNTGAIHRVPQNVVPTTEFERD